MARYELSDGSSNKFWEITLAGASFTTTYGRIGAAGQTTIKKFGSPAEAKKEHDKLVAEKVKKGYLAVGGGKKAAAKPAAAKPAAAKPAAAKPAAAKLGPHLAAVIARIRKGKKRKPAKDIAELLESKMPDDLRAFLTAKAEHVHGRFTVGDLKLADDHLAGDVPREGTDMSESRADRLVIGQTGGGDLFVVELPPLGKGKQTPVMRVVHDEDWIEIPAGKSLDAFIYQCVLECEDPEMIDIELP